MRTKQCLFLLAFFGTLCDEQKVEMRVSSITVSLTANTFQANILSAVTRIWEYSNISAFYAEAWLKNWSKQREDALTGKWRENGGYSIRSLSLSRFSHGTNVTFSVFELLSACTNVGAACGQWLFLIQMDYDFEVSAITKFSKVNVKWIILLFLAFPPLASCWAHFNWVRAAEYN